jgi:hypothetical protein
VSGWTIEELNLPQLISFIRGDTMPVAKKVLRPSEQAMKEAVKIRNDTRNSQAKKTEVTKRTPPKREGPTARQFITRVLIKGVPRAEIVKHAKALATKEGADVSFKTFDVGYFIEYLREKKGFKFVEKNGTIKGIAPKDYND